jgi:hypothetical protein
VGRGGTKPDGTRHSRCQESSHHVRCVADRRVRALDQVHTVEVRRSRDHRPPERSAPPIGVARSPVGEAAYRAHPLDAHRRRPLRRRPPAHRSTRSGSNAATPQRHLDATGGWACVSSTPTPTGGDGTRRVRASKSGPRSSADGPSPTRSGWLSQSRSSSETCPAGRSARRCGSPSGEGRLAPAPGEILNSARHLVPPYMQPVGRSR